MAGALMGMIWAVGAMSAPMHSPVQWSLRGAPAHGVKAGGRFDVVLVGKVEPGWHTYALGEPEGGPIATQVSLTEGDPADIERVNGAKPKMLQDAVFGKMLGLYENSAEFTLHVRMERAAQMGPQVLHVLVRFQACSETICLAPRTETVELPVVVGK